MSARSIIRRHRRESARRRKAGVVAGTLAAGAAALGAPAAQAANFQVTNLADSGPGSLRAAIDSANADATVDTITFASGLTGEIALTSGELELDAAVTIQGPGAGTLSISGENSSRIFFADAANVGASRDPVSISGLTLTKGFGSDGGAIHSAYSSLSLDDVTITNNVADSTGGAIDTESSPVTITDSTITGNESGSGGGFMYTDGVNANNDDQDTVTIRNSVIANNKSGSNGGALYVDNATGGDILIVDSTVEGNESASDGGGLFFYGSKGLVTVRNSTVSGNTTAYTGGGIHFNSDYYEDGLVVENSTISGNDAGKDGGGIYLENTDEDPVAIRNSTVAGNVAAEDGGGIFRKDFDASISSTIVADNAAPGAQDDLGQDPAATEAFVIGNSLIEQGANAVTVTQTPAGTNKLGADPQLGTLANNGGPTKTQAPASTSPAVDAGVANGLAADQRGLNRTVDQPLVPNSAGSDGTDIGAVELQDEVVEGAAVSAKKKQKQKGKKIVVKLAAGAAEPVAMEAGGKIKAGKKNYPLQGAAKTAGAAQQAQFKLKPKSKKAAKKIAKFLSKRKKAKAKLAVTFTDLNDNETTRNTKVTLVKAKKKKR